MTKIREAIKERKQTRIMEKQTKTLRIEWEKERGLCGIPKRQVIVQNELSTQQCFLCAHVP